MRDLLNDVYPPKLLSRRDATRYSLWLISDNNTYDIVSLCINKCFNGWAWNFSSTEQNMVQFIIQKNSTGSVYKIDSCAHEKSPRLRRWASPLCDCGRVYLRFQSKSRRRIELHTIAGSPGWQKIVTTHRDQPGKSFNYMDDKVHCRVELSPFVRRATSREDGCCKSQIP